VNIILLTLRFKDMAKFTTSITPLSLLILCKLSFPIVSLNMSSLQTLALQSPNKMVFREFIKHMFQFLVEVVTPATS
jgi:hypothetical protein